MTSINRSKPTHELPPLAIPQVAPGGIIADAQQVAIGNDEGLAPPRMRTIALVNSILELEPYQPSAAGALAALEKILPSAVLTLTGPELDPTGITCNGVGLTFPFWNISLFELAADIPDEECWDPEVAIARALVSP